MMIILTRVVVGLMTVVTLIAFMCLLSVILRASHTIKIKFRQRRK